MTWLDDDAIRSWRLAVELKHWRLRIVRAIAIRYCKPASKPLE